MMLKPLHILIFRLRALGGLLLKGKKDEVVDKS